MARRYRSWAICWFPLRKGMKKFKSLTPNRAVKAFTKKILKRGGNG